MALVGLIPYKSIQVFTGPGLVQNQYFVQKDFSNSLPGELQLLVKLNPGKHQI